MTTLETTLERCLRPLLFLAAALSLVVAAGIVFFLSTHPVSYQKIMSLTPAPAPEIDWEGERRILNAESVIGAIPYSGSDGLALVLPSQLYEATLLNGYGNCANKCRGMSYYLEQRSMRFQRVELLPVRDYLRGYGHVLIRAKHAVGSDVRVGMLDMLEGGYLAKDGAALDLDGLRAASPFTVSIVPLNARCDRQSDYYGTFLETVVFAVADSEAISRYFRWVEMIYVPIGNPKVERFFCNASAIVLGIFPPLHVSQADYERLIAPNMGVYLMAQSMTWATRILLVLLPVLAAMLAFLTYRRRARAARSRHTDDFPSFPAAK